VFQPLAATNRSRATDTSEAMNATAPAGTTYAAPAPTTPDGTAGTFPPFGDGADAVGTRHPGVAGAAGLRWLDFDPGSTRRTSMQPSARLTLALAAALATAPLSAQAPPRAGPDRATSGAHLGDLSWPEAEVRLREAPMVIVPFGAGAKEHGPHLPMSTDRIMLEYLMQVAVDSLPVVVAPPVLHGWFPAFREFPGTEIPDAELFRRTLEEVARSLVRHGARRIVFLNTGITYSTGLPIAVAAREIHQRDGVPTLVVSWGDLETDEVAALAEQRLGGHADELETSVVLALRPDLVHMERAPTDYGPARGEPGPGYRPGGFSRIPGHPEHSTTGILGDATLATAEKGRRVIEIMTGEWVRALRAFATEPLGGKR